LIICDIRGDSRRDIHDSIRRDNIRHSSVADSNIRMVEDKPEQPVADSIHKDMQDKPDMVYTLAAVVGQCKNQFVHWLFSRQLTCHLYQQIQKTQ
jgi:hypothetical protein